MSPLEISFLKEARESANKALAYRGKRDSYSSDEVIEEYENASRSYTLLRRGALINANVATEFVELTVNKINFYFKTFAKLLLPEINRKDFKTLYKILPKTANQIREIEPNGIPNTVNEIMNKFDLYVSPLLEIEDDERPQYLYFTRALWAEIRKNKVEAVTNYKRLFYSLADKGEYALKALVHGHEFSVKSGSKDHWFSLIHEIVRIYFLHLLRGLRTSDTEVGCFICYNRNDDCCSKWLEKSLVPDIQKTGIVPDFFDKNKSAGMDQEEYNERVRTIDQVILVGTPKLIEESKQTDYLKKQITYLKNRTAVVFPILYRGTKKTAIDPIYSLESKLETDFRTPHYYYQKLIFLVTTQKNTFLSHRKLEQELFSFVTHIAESTNPFVNHPANPSPLQHPNFTHPPQNIRDFLGQPIASLTTVNFSKTNATDEDTKALADHLPTSQIESINLSHNKITYTGLKAIAKRLLDSRVTYLDLGDNKIGDKSMPQLAEKLLDPVRKTRAKEISYINLSGNGIDKDLLSAMQESFPTICFRSHNCSNQSLADSNTHCATSPSNLEVIEIEKPISSPQNNPDEMDQMNLE